MLANILSWAPNSVDIYYSSVIGAKRKLYSYDIFTMVSRPISFKDDSWFEIQAIHNEQFILHVWKKGIYLFDTVEKRAQKMVKTELCHFFNYDISKKKLVYSNLGSAYLFDPISMKQQKIISHSQELIIDPLHKTFISVSQNEKNSLSIFFKGEEIFSIKNAFNIYVDPNYTKLIYLTEESDLQKSTLHVLDLDTLKELYKETLSGLLQNSNQVDDSILFNLQLNQSYGLYLFDSQSFTLKPIELREHTDQLFSALAPNKLMIAIVMDNENSSSIELIEF